MAPMATRATRIRLPIILVLLSGSAGMTLIAVAITLWLGFASALENSRSLMFDRAEQLIDGLLKDIAAELVPARKQAIWIAAQVAAGKLDPNSGPTWDQTLRALPAAAPQIISAGFMDLDLQGFFYDVISGQFVRQNHAQNPRLQKERKRVETVRGVQHLPPIWIAPLQRLGLASWIPLRRDNKLLGVFTVTVAISDISRKIAEGAERTGITPFILFDSSWVLAHPKFSGWRPRVANDPAGANMGLARGTVPLPELETFDDPVLTNIWTAETLPTQRFNLLSRTRVSFLETDGGERIFVTRNIAEYGARPWTVGAHFGVEIFQEEFERLRLLAILGIVVLLVGVFVGLLITRWSARPIQRLAVAARQVRAGDFGAVTPLPESRLRELDEASSSFNDMVEGLKEKELIRGLFGKFMPEAVAEKLLEDEGQLKPHRAEATIFFVDIEGFTAMSEKLEPEAIAELLNEYFSAAFEIIERHGGVITQFQGDAVLAIFNVPLPDPDHAQKAVQAAIDLQAAVAARSFGGQDLKCRVGINTGQVVAANVGAADRMNYTVHGDSVNLAARLEAMNKEFGTGILISGSAAALLQGVELRQLGEVEVRGKEEKVTIHTLAGE